MYLQTDAYLKPFAGRAIIVIAAWVTLSGAAIVWGNNLGHRLLPLFRWEIEKLGASRYQVTSFHIEEQNGEFLFQLKVRTTEDRRKGGKVLPRGSSISSSTLLAHALQPAIVLFVLVLAWPVPKWWYRPGLLILSLPGLLLIELLDIPFVLLGAIEDLILFNLQPAALKTSFVVQWMHLMNSGGRLALGFPAFAAAIIFGRSLLKMIQRNTLPVGGKTRGKQIEKIHKEKERCGHGL